MDMHIGNSLLYVVNNYPTLSKVVLELVQNSLDSDADTIHIIIDYKNQNLCVRDNGCGISPTNFAKAITSVCNTLKKEGKKLGQFGIGLLSPLGKCQGFTITSAAKDESHAYNRWVFDCEKILSSPELPQIPMVPMPGFFFSRSGKGSQKEKQAVSWRTEVSLDRFSKDKSINSVSLSEIQSLILGQFSETMKRLDAKVTITIKPAGSAKKDEICFKAADFKGQKLGEVVYGEGKFERTTFDIYLSSKTKTGRHGKILVGVEGNEFRIPMDIFLKSVPELDRDISDVLLSGTFEGSIISSNCKLHQNRKEFFDNEARLNFLIHLESWVRNHARKHIVNIKDGEKDAWLQAVGSLAISQLEDRLKKEMPYLMEVIKNFKKGTVGTGHYGFDEAKQEQKFASSKISFNDRNGKKKKDTKKSAVDREPTLHPGHTPFTVSGKGERRRLVRGHSTGLQFVFEEMPGNDNHWEFDENIGVLVFNMRSDIWAKMESSERNLILYQQYIAIKALEMMLVPPAIRPHVFEFLQKELKSASFFITASSNLQPRRVRSEVGRKIR